MTKLETKYEKVLYLSTSFSLDTGTEARMNLSRLANNQTILDQTANVLTRVGVGDLVDFVRVDPNLAFTALEDGSGQTLLEAQVTK
jgi:hypothetical protein